MPEELKLILERVSGAAGQRNKLLIGVGDEKIGQFSPMKLALGLGTVTRLRSRVACSELLVCLDH